MSDGACLKRNGVQFVFNLRQRMRALDQHRCHALHQPVRGFPGNGNQADDTVELVGKGNVLIGYCFNAGYGYLRYIGLNTKGQPRQ